MCTSQMVRVIDLRRVDWTTGKQQVFISGGNIDQIRENYGNPTRYIIQSIPCGNCMECRRAHAAQWAFRCCKEAKEYKDNIMVTLTYNDDNVPKGTKIDPDTGECSESLTLCKRDVQLFIKRLRKHYKDQNIRYYMCGEYGDQFGRPHYHIIFFNLKVEDLYFWRYSKCEWSKDKNMLFRSKTIEQLWNKGHVELNEVNYETCCYVARYVEKKWKGHNSDEHYLLKGQVPEYTCMSRRPGIGYAFYQKNKEKFQNEETFWQTTRKGLKEVIPGRYFDKLIEKDDPDLMNKIKNQRLDKSNQHWKDILSKTDIEMHEYIDNKVSRNKLRQRFQKRTLI